MAYTQNQLIDRVSAKIDEVLPSVEGVAAEGMREAPVNFIDEVLDKAAEFILHNAPKTMVRQVIKKAEFHFPVDHPDVPGVNPAVRLIYDAVTGISVVPCPTDFLRFLTIELSDWEVPSTELLEEGDPKYRMQKNNSIKRGTAKKPQAALIGFTDYVAGEIDANFSNKGTAIECFSSKSVPTISRFHYVPKTAAIDMPDDLIDAVCWEAASRTLYMMQQPEKAGVARQQVLIYFQNKYGIIGEAK